jgi:hypothetical protein
MDSAQGGVRRAPTAQAGNNRPDETQSFKILSPGWRELISKVYQTDPLTCPACGAQMKVIAFITDYAVIDKIIHHLGVTFTAKRPPPPTRREQLY